MTSRLQLTAIATNRAVGATCLFLAIVSSWWASTRQGSDFIYPYLVSYGVLHGLPIYDRSWQLGHVAEITGRSPPAEGIFYPAGTGAATLPIALLPYDLAKVLWFLLLVASIVTAAYFIAQRQDAKSPLLLVAGGLLLTAALRWGMTPLQGAPLVIGLMAWFFHCTRERRYAAAAAISTFVLVYKFTVALPFVGLLLLDRRWREVLLAGGIAVAVHVFCFARLGGHLAFQAYAAGIAGLEKLGGINTPDPWDPASSPRTDWVYLYTGLFHDVHLARVLAFSTTVLALAWIALLARRTRPVREASEAAGYLLALTCVGNLCVYHHHYDMSLALVPLVLLVRLAWQGELRWSSSIAVLATPLAMMMVALPVATTQRLLIALAGPAGGGIMNMCFPLAQTLAIVGASRFVWTRSRVAHVTF